MGEVQDHQEGTDAWEGIRKQVAFEGVFQEEG